uniref:Uncharacterized protein n=1 Tax=Oryza rufipogon TaxID=4529 RepID=A0A0E0RGI4_ORYRU
MRDLVGRNRVEGAHHAPEDPSLLDKQRRYEPIVGLEFCNPLFVSQSGPKMHRFSLYWRTCCAKV